MTPDDLDRWQALADAATAPPWKHGPLYWEVWCVDGDGSLYERVASTHRAPEDGGEADAAFIAASREAVPALIAEVERLRRVEEAARTFIEGWDAAMLGLIERSAEPAPSEMLDVADVVMVLRAALGDPA